VDVIHLSGLDDSPGISQTQAPVAKASLPTSTHQISFCRMARVPGAAARYAAVSRSAPGREIFLSVQSLRPRALDHGPIAPQQEPQPYVAKALALPGQYVQPHAHERVVS
jgi:hypothetical protein